MRRSSFVTRHSSFRILILPLVFLLMASPAASQEPPVAPIDYDRVWMERNVMAVRIDEPIALDGLLDEPAWKLATPAADFVQWQPSPGAPTTEPTEVYFLYDDSTLYVGFICFDSMPDRIRVNDLREDFTFNGTDSVGLVIDSLNDNRSGFQFGTNPAGAKRDSQISNDSSFNNDWDGVWDVRVTRNDRGWVAEFAIPFKTLRFSNDPTQQWGLNINRRVLRLNEEGSWAPLPVRYFISRVSLAGTLHGLENIRQGRNLTVTPYGIADLTQSRDRGLGWNDGFDGGVDLKYGLTQSLTLDATYNTDFAQVEADQQQVNLTRFNLFFPEKRDFFLENSGTFTFGGSSGGTALVPFFSRRIGLGPRGTPIPILGGARVTGQAGRYDLGVLAMKTDDLDPLENPDVDPRDATPSNTYLVARLKRNLLTNSWVGALVTHRDSTEPGDTNRVYGADARLQFFNRLILDSSLLRSTTPGLVDQDQARKFEAVWDDDELAMSAGYLSIQPNFNPEVGFVRRRDMTQYDAEFTWRPLIRRSRAVRSLRFETGLQYVQGASSGEIETRDHRVTTGVQFQNNGSITLTTRETFERLADPFQIRPDMAIVAGDHTFREHSLTAQGDRSRAISGNGSVSWGEFWNGDRTSIGAGISLKPSFRWNLDVDYTRNRVTLPAGTFTTDLVGARFIYGFNPYAFFNAFVQYNTDTSQVSSNLRFNWTHSPLSDLYVVYNDTRDTGRGGLVDRAIIVKFTNLFDF